MELDVKFGIIPINPEILNLPTPTQVGLTDEENNLLTDENGIILIEG